MYKFFISFNIYTKKFKNLIFPYLLFLLITLRIPSIIPLDNHDDASQLAIEFFYINKYLMGIDYLQNVSFFGFISYPDLFTPYLFNYKILFNGVIITSFYINLIILISSNKKLKLFNIIIFSIPIILNSWDAFIYMYYYILILNFSNNKCNKFQIIASILTSFIMAILCFAKGTLLFLSLLIIIAYIYCGNILNYIRILLFLVSIILICLYVNLTASNLISLLQNIKEFSNGYNYGMSLYESNYLLICLVIGYSLLLILLAIELRNNKITKIQFFASACLFFIIWKHSIVRSDAHLLILLQTILFALVILFSTFNESDKKYKLILLLSTSFIIVISIQISGHGNLISFIYDSKLRIINNIKYLYNPNNYYFTKNNKFVNDNNIINNKLFECFNINSNFSYWGFLPYRVLLHPNFKSNPIPTSFSSWNEFSKKISLNFISHNVNQIIIDYKTIDNNYIYLDDSLSQIELVQNFKFYKKCGRSELFVKKNNKISYSLINKKEFHFKTSNVISIQKSISTGWLIGEIEVEETIFDKIQSFLYKPPLYNIIINNKLAYKLNIFSSRSNFIVNTPVKNSAQKSLSIIDHPLSINITCTNFGFTCERNYVFKLKSVEVI